MPWDYLIDPVTRDLVPDGVGGFVKVYTAQTSVMNQLLARRGQCWQDEELGSTLHDLRAMQASPETMAPDAVQLALERLVRAGRIADVEATADRTPGRVTVATRMRDTTSGSLIELRLTGGK